MMENVILVDEKDNETGLMPKLEAHQKGELHRALSVFIFNSNGQVLMQQRALHKYHSGGLWSNTCCSHPRPGEAIQAAAQRRLKEEMGIDCILEPAFNFIYKAALDNGLVEYEYDHVFIGKSDAVPQPDAEEVCDYKYTTIDLLSQEISQHPANFTYWLRQCLPMLRQHPLSS